MQKNTKERQHFLCDLYFVWDVYHLGTFTLQCFVMFAFETLRYNLHARYVKGITRVWVFDINLTTSIYIAVITDSNYIAFICILNISTVYLYLYVCIIYINIYLIFYVLKDTSCIIASTMLTLLWMCTVTWTRSIVTDKATILVFLYEFPVISIHSVLNITI